MEIVSDPVIRGTSTVNALAALMWSTLGWSQYLDKGKAGKLSEIPAGEASCQGVSEASFWMWGSRLDSLGTGNPAKIAERLPEENTEELR